MSEDFQYGELVDVRDYDNEAWRERHYIDTLEFGDTGQKWHYTHLSDEGPGNHEGHHVRWRQVRKIQKPENDRIGIEQPETIEQRMDNFEAILNGAIKHINEQFDSIKKQLK